MNELNVAICDSEASYSERFASYLVEHKGKNVRVHIYTDKELFTKDMERERFDIAVIGGKYSDAGREVGGRGIPVLILSDVMPAEAAESTEIWRNIDACDGKQGAMCREIFRYQPMEGIIHEMQVVAAKGLILETGMGEFRRNVEVIGVYSPDRHEMQMPFSVVTAATIAEKAKVLYINLMEFSGFAELLGAESVGDMSDIFLHLRAHDLTSEIFMMNVYEMEGISYIPPFNNPGNLHELELSDMYELLGFIDSSTCYETVIFDFGEGFADFDRMLGVCGTIYCPTRRGYYYECCVKDFRGYIERSVVPGISERLKIVELPYSAKSIRGGGEVLRQLLWSDFGDYVRGYLTGSGRGDGAYGCKDERECS